MEKKVTKVKLIDGRFYTITIEKETSTHIEGFDLYNLPIKIPKEKIEERYPVSGSMKKW